MSAGADRGRTLCRAARETGCDKMPAETQPRKRRTKEKSRGERTGRGSDQVGGPGGGGGSTGKGGRASLLWWALNRLFERMSHASNDRQLHGWPKAAQVLKMLMMNFYCVAEHYCAN